MISDVLSDSAHDIRRYLKKSPLYRDMEPEVRKATENVLAVMDGMRVFFDSCWGEELTIGQKALLESILALDSGRVTAALKAFYAEVKAERREREERRAGHRRQMVERIEQRRKSKEDSSQNQSGD